MEITDSEKAKLLNAFRSSSANDESFKNLWYKGASLYIPQINELLNLTPDNSFELKDIDHFKNEDQNYLGDIFSKHKSDKSTQHNYHILYSFILNSLGKDKELNLLEIGLGTNNGSLVSSMGAGGTPGASIRAFKEYLPNSNIYGADIDKEILFEEDRIKTCYVDQLEIDSFSNITETFGDIKYDLIIDDGLHSTGANLNTLLFALNNLKGGGWIVIEDIGFETFGLYNNWKVVHYILSKLHLEVYMVKARHHCLFCVRKNYIN